MITATVDKLSTSYHNTRTKSFFASYWILPLIVAEGAVGCVEKDGMELKKNLLGSLSAAVAAKLPIRR